MRLFVIIKLVREMLCFSLLFLFLLVFVSRLQFFLFLSFLRIFLYLRFLFLGFLDSFLSSAFTFSFLSFCALASSLFLPFQ